MGGQPPQPRAPGPPRSSLPATASRWESVRDHLFAFSLIFTSLFLLHAPLLRLPYFWDEAGYFVPAARDLLLTGSLIPHTTLSNAHPPLVMLWLAFWWKYSGFTPAVTRTAMLLVAAFALLGVWRLARRVANNQVAVATVVCTALYPVFFTQSSMAHLDMMVCALTIWGLAMYVERRPVATVVFLALAPLAKETAIITPMALLGWELLCPLLTGKQWQGEAWCFQGQNWLRSISLLLCTAATAAVVRLPSLSHRILAGQSGISALQPRRNLDPIARGSRHTDPVVAFVGIPEPLCADHLHRIRHVATRTARARWQLSPSHHRSRATGLCRGDRRSRPGSLHIGWCGAGALHASRVAAGNFDLPVNPATAAAALGLVCRGGERGICIRAAYGPALPHRAGRHPALSRLRHLARPGRE